MLPPLGIERVTPIASPEERETFDPRDIARTTPDKKSLAVVGALRPESTKVTQ
jgi:hypothetical protein